MKLEVNKPETRRPKAEGRPKPEIRNPKQRRAAFMPLRLPQFVTLEGLHRAWITRRTPKKNSLVFDLKFFGFRISDFGLLSDFGLRPSDFLRPSAFEFRVFNYVQIHYWPW